MYLTHGFSPFLRLALVIIQRVVLQALSTFVGGSSASPTSELHEFIMSPGLHFPIARALVTRQVQHILTNGMHNVYFAWWSTSLVGASSKHGNNKLHLVRAFINSLVGYVLLP